MLTQQEFNTRLRALGQELPVVALLLEKVPFSRWAKHLQQDAYARMGLFPVTMYEERAPVGMIMNS